MNSGRHVCSGSGGQRPRPESRLHVSVWPRPDSYLGHMGFLEDNEGTWRDL